MKPALALLWAVILMLGVCSGSGFAYEPFSAVGSEAVTLVSKTTSKGVTVDINGETACHYVPDPARTRGGSLRKQCVMEILKRAGWIFVSQIGNKQFFDYYSDRSLVIKVDYGAESSKGVLTATLNTALYPGGE